VVKDDEMLDDDELAYGVTGLFGASGPSPGKVSTATGGFNVGGFQVPQLPSSAKGAGSTKTGEPAPKFELPALVKTGKEIMGDIKMPALPLKANLKKKNLEEDTAVKEAMAYLSTEIKTPVADKVPFPLGDEKKGIKPPNATKKPPKTLLRRPR